MSKDKENNFVDEMILTLSNKKSMLSSKKIERFIIFNVFLFLTIFFIWTKMDTLEARDFIEIMIVWLSYGGYNSFMNFRDRKMERTTEDVNAPISPNTPPVEGISENLPS